MPKFVVLLHESPKGDHFDLMLEADDVLKTWAISEAPTPEKTIECDALPDHRLAYLDYEGPISGNRGSVTRWDAGEYQTQRRSDAEWLITVAGKKICGEIVLSRPSDAENRWRLCYSPQKDG